MDYRDDDDQYYEAFAGDDLAIPVQLLDGNGVGVKLGSGDGVTDIVAEFLSNDGSTIVQQKQSVTAGFFTHVDDDNGRLLVNVAASVSANLMTDRIRKQTFDVYVITNGKQQTWSFTCGLKLKPRPLPPAS